MRPKVERVALLIAALPIMNGGGARTLHAFGCELRAGSVHFALHS